MRTIVVIFWLTAAAGLAQTGPEPAAPLAGVKANRKRLPSVDAAKTSLAAEKQEALRAAVELANEDTRTVRGELPGANPTAPAPTEPSKPEPPQTPGNDIYRWVDARGVIHYSTHVPPALKGVATKVGASRASP